MSRFDTNRAAKYGGVIRCRIPETAATAVAATSVALPCNRVMLSAPAANGAGVRMAYAVTAAVLTAVDLSVAGSTALVKELLIEDLSKLTFVPAAATSTPTYVDIQWFG